MWRVTIEDLDCPEATTILEYEHVSIQEERSVDTIMGTTAETYGRAVDIVPNGFQRACIRLWARGNSYENFPSGRTIGLTGTEAMQAAEDAAFLKLMNNVQSRIERRHGMSEPT